MARLNNLDGGRSVFVPTEFQAHFAPEVRGHAVLNNPSPMEKSCLLLWGSGQCKILRSCRLRYRAIGLRAESTSWGTPPPAAPQMDSRLSSTFPLTVSTTSSRPPFPIRPSTLRPPRLPLTDRGKS